VRCELDLPVPPIGPAHDGDDTTGSLALPLLGA
jgi:hypothetical protein